MKRNSGSDQHPDHVSLVSNMAASEPRSERADARLNRERIIEAARSLFLEHGTAVEMRHLAERAGVGVGTIYRNFPAKSDLIAAVAAAVLDETDAELEAVFAIDDPVELVRRHIATLLRTFSTTAPLAMEMMAAPTFETMRGRVLAWLTDPRLDAAIQRGIRCGCFRADLDIPAARLFIAGAADPLVVMAACPPLTPARLEARLAELVLRALLAPGQPLPADLAPAGQKGT